MCIRDRMNIDDMPVMMLSVNHKTEPNLYNYVDNVIVPEIEKITDVSDAVSYTHLDVYKRQM